MKLYALLFCCLNSKLFFTIEELSKPPERVNAIGTSALRCIFMLSEKTSSNSSLSKVLLVLISKCQYFFILMDDPSMTPIEPDGKEFIPLKKVFSSSSHHPLNKYFKTVF